jgi:Uma2 family endonuclease
MAASTQISLGEYLQTSYRPDVEYIDGELKEKTSMGKYEHSRLQALLAAWFIKNQDLWRAVALTEQRVQVSSDRVRIPDLILVPMGPSPDVIVAPPLLVVEILSADDSYSELQERSQDYRAMGVETIWIIDPRTRTARTGTGDNWLETRRLEVAGSEIYVDVDALFADLDLSRA